MLSNFPQTFFLPVSLLTADSIERGSANFSEKKQENNDLKPRPFIITIILQNKLREINDDKA